jgi:hypothetical protein
VEITYATEGASGAVNEDYVVAGPQWVAVLDGATPRSGVDTGCVHDVPWLVHRLGTELARRLILVPDLALSEALAETITAVRAAHESTCDLNNPDSPSSTVAVVRQRSEKLDYLVLGDSPLLLDIDGSIHAIIDDRNAYLPRYTAEIVRAHRNQPHGFWVASTVPEAAYRAITDSRPMVGLRRAALLSDGASRYVERLGLGKWTELVDVLEQYGPADLIQRVRVAERAQLPLESVDPVGRRIKRHDDATAVLIHFEPRGSAGAAMFR